MFETSICYFHKSIGNTDYAVNQEHRVDRVLSFFFSRPNWDSPTPSSAGERASPLWFGRGGRYTLVCGRGGEGVPIPTRGQTLWYSRYICTLWPRLFTVPPASFSFPFLDVHLVEQQLRGVAAAALLLRQHHHDQEAALPTRHHTQQQRRLQHLRGGLHDEGISTETTSGKF